MNIVRLAIALLVLVSVAVIFVRFVVPVIRRATQGAASPVVVPGAVVPPPGSFPLASGHGYDPADVDELFDRVYALAANPSGRPAALEAVRTTRFHVTRRGGYEPVFVDDRIDALTDALSAGRELPPHPGWR